MKIFLDSDDFEYFLETIVLLESSLNNCKETDEYIKDRAELAIKIGYNMIYNKDFQMRLENV